MLFNRIFTSRILFLSKTTCSSSSPLPVLWSSSGKKSLSDFAKKDIIRSSEPEVEAKTVMDFKEYVLFRDENVAEVLKNKATTEIFAVHLDSSVKFAIDYMIQKKIGAVVVLNNERRMVGIFTERDFLRNRGLLAQGEESREIQIREVMTKNLITVKSNEPVANCLRLMTEKKLRHLPVESPKDPLICEGIISIGDLVYHILREQQSTISLLKDYVQRTY